MSLDDRIEAMARRVERDEREIGVLSTGEQIAVCVVLDRRDLVPAPYNESWQDALDRLGEEWLAASRRVAKRFEPRPTSPPVDKPLQDAIAMRERDYERALDRLERRVEDMGPRALEAVRELREALFLLRCLRRALAGRNVEEIHRAFGAPGDFGYETLIGDTLSKIYRGEGAG